MRSPDFIPRYYEPLQFVAIGSGAGLEEHIELLRDMIFASDPGNVHMEALWFTAAVQRFLQEKNLPDVGGLFPILRLIDGEVQPISRSARQVPDGYHIELINENGRWIQKNCSTGRNIELLPPWDVLPENKNRIFDDLRNFPL